MALQQILDVTEQVNLSIPIGIGAWDYGIFQFINTDAASMSFYGTNDSGAVQGVSDGNYKSATNFIPIMGLDLSTRTYTATSLGGASAANYMIKFDGVGQFLYFEGSTCEKVILRLYKIS